MKLSLIDVPVLITTFVRHNTFRQVFDVIKTVRPSVLFVASDGPRIGNDTDIEMINQCRLIVEEIDWECQVFKLYSDVNLGLLNNTFAALRFAFDRVESLIFLEDDILPSESFFLFCSTLLDKYKNDQRIHMICGMNHIGQYNKPDADYFFSQKGSIWGFALWKRTFDLFDNNIALFENKYTLKILKENTDKNLFRSLKSKIKNWNVKINNSKINCNDFELLSLISMILNNSLLIVPKKNMITCLGITNNSEHTPNNRLRLVKSIRNLFDMIRFEITFPLKHPSFVARDKEYENFVNQIMGKNYFVNFTRKFESIIRRIIYK